MNLKEAQIGRSRNFFNLIRVLSRLTDDIVTSTEKMQLILPMDGSLKLDIGKIHNVNERISVTWFWLNSLANKKLMALNCTG